MANGERDFENTAKKVDHKANETSEALFADSQKAPPTKALENSATKAPDAPTDKLDQVAGNDKSIDKGDKALSKLEQAVTANLADSAQEKIKSLNSSPEGQKLLTQEHSGGKNVLEQWKDFFPQAYDKAGLENFSKK